MKNKSRNIQLDIIRDIACFLVIVNHANSRIFTMLTPEAETWWASISRFYLSKVAVPLFLMLTGYTLLDREEDFKKSLYRIGRIIMVIIFISAIYYINDVGLSGFNIFDYLKAIYKNQTGPSLWYLYTYLGLLVMLSFLMKIGTKISNKQLAVFLGISFVFFCVYPFVYEEFPEIQYNQLFNVHLFDGFIGYLFLGLFIKKVKPKIHITFYVIFLVISNIVCVICSHSILVTGGENYLIYDNIFFPAIVIEAYCVFRILQSIKINEKISKVVCYIAKTTFGIYLISDYLLIKMEPVYQWLCPKMNDLLAVMIYEIIVYMTGIVIVSVFNLICKAIKSIIKRIKKSD